MVIGLAIPHVVHAQAYHNTHQHPKYNSCRNLPLSLSAQFSAASMYQTGRVVVGLPSVNRTGPYFRPSCRNVMAAGFIESARGMKGHWNKLSMTSSSKCASKLSVNNKSIRIFSSISLGREGSSRFIGRTSEGETEAPSYKWPDNKKPRVCILGGGFGGLYTALRLESLIWPDDKKPQVLLVDQSDHFVFKPMLYELLSGEVDAWEIAPSFTDLLKNTSIQFLKDRVKLLRPSDHLNQIGREEASRSSSGGTVLLGSGNIIEYDWLVLALGAEAKVDAVPGSLEYAIPFTTLEDARKVDDKLRKLERVRFGKDSPPICVTIVGCGYSGVELTATISERLQNKGKVQAVNVQSTICPSAPAGNREVALKVLESRNVELYLGYYVSCIKESGISKDSATMTRNEEDLSSYKGTPHSKLVVDLQPSERGLKSQILETDLVLWTVGSKPLVSELEPHDQPPVLQLNARGQAETDETLRVKGHPRIFAIGDSAALRDSSGRLLPATAQVAFQQADFAGWNLWAAINDRPLLPFRFQNLGEMMTLGRNDAAITASFIEGLTLDGPLGHAARKLVYWMRLPTDEHRAKVGISWLTKSAIDSVASLQSTLAKVIAGA